MDVTTAITPELLAVSPGKRLRYRVWSWPLPVPTDNMVLKLVLAIVCLIPQVACADLWQGGFESNLGWTGSNTFVSAGATEGAAENGARFFDFIDSDTISESGVWIEDGTRAHAGDRFFWIRDYNDPDTICVGKRFNGLVAGQWYDLDWHFAAFDPDNPAGGTQVSKPIVEVMSWDAAASDWVLSEPVMNFSDGNVTDYENGIVTEYQVQDWDNLAWTKSSSRFAIPELNGQPLYVWVSMTNDSAGLLIDSISFQAVPEPSSMFLASLFLWLGVARRKRHLTRSSI